MPLDPDVIETAIESTAAGPAEVSVDGQMVQAQSLKDLIEAHKYAAGQTATSSRNHLGIQFRKLVPPGSV